MNWSIHQVLKEHFHNNLKSNVLINVFLTITWHLM